MEVFYIRAGCVAAEWAVDLDEIGAENACDEMKIRQTTADRWQLELETGTVVHTTLDDIDVAPLRAHAQHTRSETMTTEARFDARTPDELTLELAMEGKTWLLGSGASEGREYQLAIGLGFERDERVYCPTGIKWIIWTKPIAECSRDLQLIKVRNLQRIYDALRAEADRALRLEREDFPDNGLENFPYGRNLRRRLAKAGAALEAVEAFANV